jgi:hypothetical protein
VFAQPLLARSYPQAVILALHLFCISQNFLRGYAGAAPGGEVLEIHKDLTKPALPAAVSRETVVLRGQEVELTSPEGHRLVVACTRAGENLISDADVISEFQISDAEWKAIAANAALGRAIKAESQRRINNGTAARESAAKIFAKAPEVLGRHLNDPAANARSVVEVHRELRATVHGPGAENAPDAGQPFIIKIDLSAAPGGEVLEIHKDLTKPALPAIEHNDSESVVEEQDQ